MKKMNYLTQTWNISSFAVGLGLLIWGSFYYQAPDWDIPICFIMATLAYLTAPASMRIILERRWKYMWWMLISTWATVDGCYWLYWSIIDPSALHMRPYNFGASLALYWACGLVWYNKRGIIW